MSLQAAFTSHARFGGSDAAQGVEMAQLLLAYHVRADPFLGAASAFSAIHPDRLELAAFAAALAHPRCAERASRAKGANSSVKVSFHIPVRPYRMRGWAGIVSQ